MEEVVLKDDYFYRADLKYDLYLGHLWHLKNRVAPVGHRRCFFCWNRVPWSALNSVFFHAGFKSAEEFLKQKVAPKFGENVTIAEVNGCSEYAWELEFLSRDNQQRRPSRSHSSSYRVVEKFLSTTPLPHITMRLQIVKTDASKILCGHSGPKMGQAVVD